MKTKIGVITFFNYCNFGAVLQCYGLSTVLHRLGCDVEYIDYTCPFIGNPFGLKSIQRRGLIGYMYTIAGFLFYIPRHGLFRKFRTLIPHSNPVSPKNVADYADCYDKYIAGSDQIWNTRLTDFDKTYFLDFVKDPLKKISYAASFGGANINDGQHQEIAKLLSDFKAISVREVYGQEIVKELTGKHAVITSDPTLLPRRDDWESIAASKPRSMKPYILVYQLGFSGKVIQATRTLKHEKSMRVEYVPFPLGVPVLGRYHLHLGPREWIALFRDAEYVVTDSFHGVVFSLLFEKKFIVVAAGQHKNQRVISLLARFGLLNRVYDDDMPNMDDEIDYECVNKILEKDRQMSIEWLRQNV